MILFERDILIINLHTDLFTYNLGGGLRLLYVYIGGAHEKKVGNHCYIQSQKINCEMAHMKCANN